MDRTAAELADALDDMRLFPHNTAGMSMLDEATIAYGRVSPALSEAQRAFAQARDVHRRSVRREGADYVYSDEAWAAALAAGRRLAALLRELGNFRIARCQRQAGWGRCNLPLGDDGECPSREHVDGTERSDQAAAKLGEPTDR